MLVVCRVDPASGEDILSGWEIADFDRLVFGLRTWAEVAKQRFAILTSDLGEKCTVLRYGHTVDVEFLGDHMELDPSRLSTGSQFQRFGCTRGGGVRVKRERITRLHADVHRDHVPRHELGVPSSAQ